MRDTKALGKTARQNATYQGWEEEKEGRGKEGKDIKGKATDDEHILARIPNFQIPNSLPGFPSHSP